MQLFGTYLKEEREKREVRLEEIASSTKIHIQSLLLMEENRWKELPQEPFIRGFIAAYAKYLGLDSKETLKLFSQSQAAMDSLINENFEASTSTTPVSRSIEIPISEKKLSSHLEKINLGRTFSMKIGLSIAGILFIGGIVLYRGLNQPLIIKDSSQTASPVNTPLSLDTPVAPTTPQPSAPAIVQDAAAIEPSTPPTPAPALETVPLIQPSEPPIKTPESPPAVVVVTPEKLPTPVAVGSPPPEKQPIEVKTKPIEAAPAATIPISDHELKINAKVRTWMKIVIDEEPPKESYLEAGANIDFKYQKKIKLVLGNSTGVSVINDAEDSKGKKYSGTIRYYIFPKGARFPQDKPKNTNSEGSFIDENENTSSQESSQSEPQ